MSRATVAVEPLADRPGCVGAVAGWLHREWFRAAGLSRPASEAALRERLQRDALPLALVALAGRRPVGTASLVLGEHPSRPGQACQLNGVYVLPSWRGQGIGAALCACALAEAERLGHGRPALYTRNAEAFYARLGWQRASDSAAGVGRRLELVTFMV